MGWDSNSATTGNWRRRSRRRVKNLDFDLLGLRMSPSVIRGWKLTVTSLTHDSEFSKTCLLLDFNPDQTTGLLVRQKVRLINSIFRVFSVAKCTLLQGQISIRKDFYHLMVPTHAFGKLILPNLQKVGPCENGLLGITSRNESSVRCCHTSEKSPKIVSWISNSKR